MLFQGKYQHVTGCTNRLLNAVFLHTSCIILNCMVYLKLPRQATNCNSKAVDELVKQVLCNRYYNRLSSNNKHQIGLISVALMRPFHMNCCLCFIFCLTPVLVITSRSSAWLASGRWRMRRRWKGRRGGGGRARVAWPTPMLTSAQQSDTHPPVTTPLGQTPQVRCPRASAGYSHDLVNLLKLDL